MPSIAARGTTEPVEDRSRPAPPWRRRVCDQYHRAAALAKRVNSSHASGAATTPLVHYCPDVTERDGQSPANGGKMRNEGGAQPYMS